MIDLSKWPLLLVAGKSVTLDQANEILIRTNEWRMFSNDKLWMREVYSAAGIKLNLQGNPDVTSLRSFEAKYSILPLHYMNNSRIASAWIFGPHGWCNWNGNIGCCTYNIGKWPSADEIIEDWRRIAVAFPFLNLIAQYVPNEGEYRVPVLEVGVSGGTVEVTANPKKSVIHYDVIKSKMDQLYDTNNWLVNRTERGVTIKRLKAALAQICAP